MNKTLYVIRKDYYDTFMKKWTKLSKKRNHKDCHYSLLMHATTVDEYKVIHILNDEDNPVPDVDEFVALVMTHE